MQIMIDQKTMSLWEVQGRFSPSARKTWEREDIETVVERVNLGSEALDNYEGPGWSERVYPSDLEMSSGQFCIIGQAYSGYSDGIRVPFADFEEMEEFEGGEHTEAINRLAIRHGFLTQIHGDEVSWQLLDRVWVYMLAERAKNPGESIELRVPPRLTGNVMQMILAEAELLAAVEADDLF